MLAVNRTVVNNNRLVVTVDSRTEVNRTVARATAVNRLVVTAEAAIKSFSKPNKISSNHANRP